MAGAFGAWADRHASADACNGAISIEYALVTAFVVLMAGLVVTGLSAGWPNRVDFATSSFHEVAEKTRFTR